MHWHGGVFYISITMCYKIVLLGDFSNFTFLLLLSIDNLLWNSVIPMVTGDGYNFIAEISKSLSNCPWLKGIYLSDNHLSGKDPRWLGNLTDFVEIFMPNNHLSGPIPMEFCQLKFGHFREGNISDFYHLCFNLLAITQVHLSKKYVRRTAKRQHIL